MNVWRKVALEKIPKLKRLIEKAPNVMTLWIELQLKLAYGDFYQSQLNEKTIAGIFDYASWCLNKSHNWDTKTAAVCAFYEHLPRMKAVRKELPNHLSMEDFLKLEQDFKYLLSDEEHQEFIKEFLECKAATHNKSLDVRRNSDFVMNGTR